MNNILGLEGELALCWADAIVDIVLKFNIIAIYIVSLSGTFKRFSFFSFILEDLRDLDIK